MLCFIVLAVAAEQKRQELLRLRQEQRTASKAHAMASRTKDNLKMFNCENKASVQDQVVPTPDAAITGEVDLKHLFSKNDRRVARAPSEMIPNMLEQIKERERLRKERQRVKEEKERLEREAADAVAAEELHAKVSKTHEHHRHKSHGSSSKDSCDHKRLKMSTGGETIERESGCQHDSDQKSGKGQSHDVSNGKSSSSASKFKIPKKSLPPPMSFEQLLAIAQKNEPAAGNGTDASVPVSPKPYKGPDRPMTQEEKERETRRNTKEYQDWLKNGGPMPQWSIAARTGQKRKRPTQISGSISSDDDDTGSECEAPKRQKPTSSHAMTNGGEKDRLKCIQKTETHQSGGMSHQSKSIGSGTSVNKIQSDDGSADRERDEKPNRRLRDSDPKERLNGRMHEAGRKEINSQSSDMCKGDGIGNGRSQSRQNVNDDKCRWGSGGVTNMSNKAQMTDNGRANGSLAKRSEIRDSHDDARSVGGDGSNSEKRLVINGREISKELHEKLKQRQEALKSQGYAIPSIEDLLDRIKQHKEQMARDAKPRIPEVPTSKETTSKSSADRNNVSKESRHQVSSSSTTSTGQTKPSSGQEPLRKQLVLKPSESTASYRSSSEGQKPTSSRTPSSVPKPSSDKKQSSSSSSHRLSYSSGQKPNTGPSSSHKPSAESSSQKPSSGKKPDQRPKYAVENESVIVCGSSKSSKPSEIKRPSKPPETKASEKQMSTWDRIYSKIQQERPKLGQLRAQFLF